jgi:Mg-chelatase subunit ChlD
VLRLEPVGKVTLCSSSCTIDDSGSMKGDRWAALQNSFSAYMTVLTSNGSSSDIVSVIQFDNTARVVAESSSAQDAAALNLSMKGGGTTFGPALLRTMELLRRDSSTCDVILVFMTDGDNQDDETPIDVLRQLFGEFASRNPKFNAIGFTNQPPVLVKMVEAVAPNSALYAAGDTVQLQRTFVEVAEAMCMSEGVRKNNRFENNQ